MIEAGVGMFLQIRLGSYACVVISRYRSCGMTLEKKIVMLFLLKMALRRDVTKNEETSSSLMLSAQFEHRQDLTYIR